MNNRLINWYNKAEDILAISQAVAVSDVLDLSHTTFDLYDLSDGWVTSEHSSDYYTSDIGELAWMMAYSESEIALTKLTYDEEAGLGLESYDDTIDWYLRPLNELLDTQVVLIENFRYINRTPLSEVLEVNGYHILLKDGEFYLVDDYDTYNTAYIGDDVKSVLRTLGEYDQFKSDDWYVKFDNLDTSYNIDDLIFIMDDFTSVEQWVEELSMGDLYLEFTDSWHIYDTHFDKWYAIEHTYHYLQNLNWLIDNVSEVIFYEIMDTDDIMELNEVRGVE